MKEGAVRPNNEIRQHTLERASHQSTIALPEPFAGSAKDLISP